MKLFLLHPVAVRWLPAVVIASALMVAPGAYAQSGVNVAGLQEQGDEMSRQVGGFFRKLFYGEDRNAQPQQQQRPYYQQPQPYQNAPQRQPGYQYAPPPSGSNTQRNAPPPERQRQQAPATTSRKAPARTPEPEKPKHKEEPAASRSTPKRPAVQSTPPKQSQHDDEPAGKQVAKRKNSYTPPTIAGDDSEPKVKRTPKSEPPKPVHKEKEKEKDYAAKPPVQDQPPSTRSTRKTEPSTVAKSSPPKPEDEPGGLSPYTDGYAGGGTTIKAPKQTPPPAKTEEPKSKDTKPSSNPAAGGDGSYPVGTVSPTHPGTVVSPYPPHNELDVSGLPSGSLAIDPTTKKVFKIP